MNAATKPSVIDFAADTGRVASAGPLAVRWIHGSPSAKHNADPDIQVYEHDEHTVILRQNKAVNYEAPFLYLLFGNTRAVLIDTGATAEPEFFPLRRTIDALIEGWLTRNPREDYGLLVVHTHAHGDHVAGDAQFADRSQTTVVPAARPKAWEFFGFDDAPGAAAGEVSASSADGTVALDLGGRVLECLPTPGHHEASVTFYDPWTGFLLTGDTVLPGRLYAFDFPQFLASLDRMIALAESRPVSHVLGCHIEMTRRPGRDYPLGARYQPDEPPLEMTVAQLWNVRAAAASVAGRQGVHRFDDFIVYNEPGLRDHLKLGARALAHKLWPRP